MYNTRLLDLHRSFIPYDEFSLLKNVMQILIPLDITGGRIINRNGKLEAGVSSMTIRRRRAAMAEEVTQRAMWPSA